jgi:hypothetical protein
MQDNSNFIMYGCVQSTEGLTYRILSHIIQILDSQCAYLIFSLMTAYEPSRNMYPIHFHYAFLNKMCCFD